jgi:hypothetical protein
VKLEIIYKALNNVSEQISFEELERKLGVPFEELEVFLFEGQERKLFRLNVDYEGKILKLRYVKQNVYSDNQLVNLKGKVSMLKEKLSKLYSNIENIKV